MAELLAYATQQWELNAPAKDGVPVRAHLKRVYDQTGVMPPELVPVAVPQPVLYVYQYFQELDAQRQGSMEPNPLSFLEMKAWSELTNTPLAVFEVRALVQLDMLWRKLRQERFANKEA